MKKLMNFFKDEDGATMVEYGLMVALIAIVCIYDGNSTNAEFSAWGGGFTEFGDFATTTGVSIGVAYKFSTGSETGTFTVTSADTSTNDYACILLSISGAHASTVPAAAGEGHG